MHKRNILALSLLSVIGICQSHVVYAQEEDESALDEGAPKAAPIALEAPGARELQEAMRRIALRPTDADALADAGNASLLLGDPNAALNFFTRANALQPASGRIKAGLAAATVRTENPFEALRLFDEAIRLGVTERAIAADRALAFDLLGNFDRAQIDYKLASTAFVSDTLIIQQAISLSLLGRKEEADGMLVPLLKKENPSAWRARAFMLAARGNLAESERVAQSFLDQDSARRVERYLRLMPQLTNAQQAAAIHLGHFPANNIGRDSEAVRTVAATIPPVPTTGPGRLIPAGTPLGAKPGKGKPVKESSQARKEREKAEKIAAAAAKNTGVVLASPIPPAAVSPQSAIAKARIEEAARASVTLTAMRDLPPPDTARPIVKVALPQQSEVKPAIASVPTPAVAPVTKPVPVPAPLPTPAPVIQPSVSPAITQAPAQVAQPAPLPAPITPPITPPIVAQAQTQTLPQSLPQAQPQPQLQPQLQSQPQPKPQPLPPPLPPPLPQPQTSVAVVSPSAQPQATTLPVPASLPAPVIPTPTPIAPAPVLPSPVPGPVSGPAIATALPGAITAPQPVLAPATTPVAAPLPTPSPAQTPAPTPAPTSPPVSTPAPPLVTNTSVLQGPGPDAPVVPAVQQGPMPDGTIVKDAPETAPEIVFVSNAPTVVAQADPVTTPKPETPPVAAAPKPFDLGSVVNAIEIPESEQRRTAAVDLKKLKPAAPKQTPEEAKAAAAKGKPGAKTTISPARFWVQIATGDKSAVGYDYKNWTKKKPDLFKGLSGWSAPWNKTSRLLVGPFADMKAAKKFEADFRKAGGNGFMWKSEEGAVVEPIKGK
jgi:tetratricopeptide (TPR) repeat protein